MSKTLTQTEVEALKKSMETIQPLVRKLAAVPKAELEDSDDKFVVIRCLRLDHTIRELLKGKSLRK